MFDAPLFQNVTEEGLNAALRAANEAVVAIAKHQGAHPGILREDIGLDQVHSLVSSARDAMHFGSIEYGEWWFVNRGRSFEWHRGQPASWEVEDATAIVHRDAEGRWTHVLPLR